MGLAEFIRENREKIVAEWETFARSLVPDGERCSSSAMRDHAAGILDAIVRDMSLSQSTAEQTAKSQGHGANRRLGLAGKVHAVVRIQSGFRLDQLVAEYRALRASVLRLSLEAGESDLEGVTRFNEAIDEALTESTNRYMEMIERHRDEFIGILGHDLRNPLGAIIMGASTLSIVGEAQDSTARIARRIHASARRMDRMVGDLLDLTRARLGAGFPIVRAKIDLADVCQQVVAEFRGGHPRDPLMFASEGDLHGEWDGDRLAQVVSNLVGNALQHGKEQAPVSLVARGEGDEVVLEVHNEGTPIPPTEVPTLFQAMVGHRRPHDKDRGSLGLGLYIADQVVTAHGGEIAVTSTATGGTTFSVHLPRSPRRGPRNCRGVDLHLTSGGQRSGRSPDE